MDEVRYYAGLLLLIAMPPGMIIWLFIHPFAQFWRKIGPVFTYALLSVPMMLLAYALYVKRDLLMVGDYGSSVPAFIVGSIAFIGAVIIGAKRHKYLKPSILAGMPELSNKRYPGKLLNEGIYAKICHPRYVEALLGVLGYVLYVNWLTGYILLLFGFVMVYLIVLLEERELCERFGSEYQEYMQRVPRFFPDNLFL